MIAQEAIKKNVCIFNFFVSLWIHNKGTLNANCVFVSFYEM